MNQAKQTLGSLFDGIGGFCLAGQMAGIKPVWASEIEPFPIRVTEKRFPDVRQLGDIHATAKLFRRWTSSPLAALAKISHVLASVPVCTANSPRCSLKLSESSKK